jgi:hypothetical protein
VRLFSEDPPDSPSRNLARYIKTVGERYVPSMRVDLIFRHDRFVRGSDHTPFNQAGFAAVRFTSAAEHYAHQHSASDTMEYASASYATLVARVNAAVAASLAWAPAAPNVSRLAQGGPQPGQLVPNLGRGKSGYAAHLKWTNEDSGPDVAGYKVMMRSTLSPYWEREVFAGNVLEYVMEGVSIDDIVIGVQTVDKAGRESLVSTFVAKPFAALPVELLIR